MSWIVGLKWQICKKPMCGDCLLRKLNQLNLFFWYRLTQVVPDNFHRAVKRLCVCVLFMGLACRASLITVLLLVL